jgi:hypothetical protein
MASYEETYFDDLCSPSSEYNILITRISIIINRIRVFDTNQRYIDIYEKYKNQRLIFKLHFNTIQGIPIFKYDSRIQLYKSILPVPIYLEQKSLRSLMSLEQKINYDIQQLNYILQILCVVHKCLIKDDCTTEYRLLDNIFTPQTDVVYGIQPPFMSFLTSHKPLPVAEGIYNTNDDPFFINNDDEEYITNLINNHIPREIPIAEIYNGENIYPIADAKLPNKRKKGVFGGNKIMHLNKRHRKPRDKNKNIKCQRKTRNKRSSLTKKNLR